MTDRIEKTVQKHIEANHLEDASFILNRDEDDCACFSYEVTLMPCAFSRYLMIDQEFVYDYDLSEYLYNSALCNGSLTGRRLSIEEWAYVLSKLQVYAANRRFCGIYAVHEYDCTDIIRLMPYVKSMEEFAIWVDLNET